MRTRAPPVHRYENFSTSSEDASFANVCAGCVCVWNIWIDVKLLPVDVDVHQFFHFFNTYGCCVFQTLVSCQFVSHSRRAVPHSRVHCQRSYSWLGRISGLIIPTYLRTFTFWSWEVANPRATTPFSNNLFLRHAIVHGFRNLSRWERFGFVEREVSASNSSHLTLAMAMVTFRFFSGLFIDPFLSGVIGVFLHVRCIPHQNSQRLFWASVWFMLDSSRWHEPFGEYLSR